MTRRQAALTATLLAAGLLLALRVPHLFGPLDDPHSWRQCDTAGYTREFTRHGIDLLHPAVCWLGDHRTLLFECPIPEAIAALPARLTGYDPFWDRLVALAFFVVSAGYLYAIGCRLLGGGAAPALATLAYLASPLAQFYSRAATVDFAAQACAHGFLWHGLRAVDARRLPHAIAAALAGALAALIKAPYVAPVAFPLALATLVSGAALAWVMAAVSVVGPASAFVLWRRYVDATNAQVPNWTWWPDFYKEVNPLWWYVGDWTQRLHPGAWVKLARRLFFEVTSPGLAMFAVAGLRRARAAAGRGPAPLGFVLAWLAGAFAYLLVFFPLNLIHNYYQVPFVAPLALLAGLGGAWLVERLPRIGPVPLGTLLFALALGLAAIMPMRLGWYRIDTLRERAGAAIRAHTPANALVVAVDHGSEFTDPRLLYRADRFGFPVKGPDVNAVLLEHLRDAGARSIVWVQGTDGDPAPPAALLAAPAGRFPVTQPDGRPLATLFVWPIDDAIAALGGSGSAE